MLRRKARGAAFLAADRAGRMAASVGLPLSLRGRGLDRPVCVSTNALVQSHFDGAGQSDHMCRSTLTEALIGLHEKPATIIETGSSAWGTNSSILFDSYVRRFGGVFDTVDIRARPMLELRGSLGSRSRAHCSDSVRFLRNWVSGNPGVTVDLAYFDSWDLDANDPWPSAMHGLQEFVALEPAIKSGSLLLIDDTPEHLGYFHGSELEAATAFFNRFGLIPGKGMLVIQHLDARQDVEKLRHEYQVLYRFL